MYFGRVKKFNAVETRVFCCPKVWALSGWCGVAPKAALLSVIYGFGLADGCLVSSGGRQEDGLLLGIGSD